MKLDLYLIEGVKANKSIFQPTSVNHLCCNMQLIDCDTVAKPFKIVFMSKDIQHCYLISGLRLVCSFNAVSCLSITKCEPNVYWFSWNDVFCWNEVHKMWVFFFTLSHHCCCCGSKLFVLLVWIDACFSHITKTKCLHVSCQQSNALHQPLEVTFSTK